MHRAGSEAQPESFADAHRTDVSACLHSERLPDPALASLDACGNGGRASKGVPGSAFRLPYTRAVAARQGCLVARVRLDPTRSIACLCPAHASVQPYALSIVHSLADSAHAARGQRPPLSSIRGMRQVRLQARNVRSMSMCPPESARLQGVYVHNLPRYGA